MHEAQTNQVVESVQEVHGIEIAGGVLEMIWETTKSLGSSFRSPYLTQYDRQNLDSILNTMMRAADELMPCIDDGAEVL